MTKEAEYQRDYFRGWYHKGVTPAQKMDCGDETTRIRLLSTALYAARGCGDLKFSVLDVGCGLGYLVEALLERGWWDSTYTGVDLVEEYVHDLKKRQPSYAVKAYVGDYWEDPACYGIHDVVVHLGANYLKEVMGDDPLTVIGKKLNVLAHSAKKVVIFDCKSIFASRKLDYVTYVDPRDVLSVCYAQGWRDLWMEQRGADLMVVVKKSNVL